MTYKHNLTPSAAINPLGTQGMVTSPHYLASQSGLAILRKGGTAIDAAIAAAATLAVVYPHMCSIGGDSFWLIYDAQSGEVRGLNASGRSAAKASIDFYTQQGCRQIPLRGYLAANTVPGIVSGWDAAYAYSQSSLQSTIHWAELLADAIHYADKGFPVSHSLAQWSKINCAQADPEYRNLQRFPNFRRNYLNKNAAPHACGDLLCLPELATSLHLLATNGAPEFYTGSIAKRIVADLEAHGGLLSLDDFARHRADWVLPLSVPYRDCIAYNLPPNTQGMASLAILNILNNFPLNKLGEDSADYYHLLVAATMEAFADRDRYLTDPDFADIPVSTLLSAKHGRAQAARIAAGHALPQLPLLDPAGDTIWLGVVDAAGNAVSLIQSIYHDFGSGIVAGDTGVLLQNRGTYFSLDATHVNALEPYKRTFHTLNPAFLMKNGKPFLVYGTMGGEGQPQTQAALVTRIVDFGMTPQEAITAPRWLYGRTWGAASNALQLEGRIAASVVAELKQRGLPATSVANFSEVMGHAGAILLNQETGIMQGATDPRGDGLAAAY